MLASICAALSLSMLASSLFKAGFISMRDSIIFGGSFFVPEPPGFPSVLGVVLRGVLVVLLTLLLRGVGFFALLGALGSLALTLALIVGVRHDRLLGSWSNVHWVRLGGGRISFGPHV